MRHILLEKVSNGIISDRHLETNHRFKATSALLITITVFLATHVIIEQNR